MATQVAADKSKVVGKSYRRVVSEIEAKTGELREESFDETESIGSEGETIQCECCGISEECTEEYISRVKAIFCSRWVCGLCSEAVKEQVRKNPSVPLRAALESHMALCVKFRRTVRVNPKLSLASSMRDIARMSSQRRSNGFFRKTLGRTSSCGAVFDRQLDSSPL